MSRSSRRKNDDDNDHRIQGGGRITLSLELENAMIDLLRSRRDPQNPLLRRNRCQQNPKKEEEEEESAHQAAHNRKKFLKLLVDCHERHSLSKRLNRRCQPQQSMPDKATTTSTKATSSSSPSSNDRRTTTAVATTTTPTGGGGGGGGGKVRINLVEAIYPKDSCSSSSKKSGKKNTNGGSSKNKTQKRDWKAGSIQKTIVMDRSTQIPMVLKQAKDKLKLKRKAVRCFYVDPKTKMEMELQTDVGGLKDGDTLYVTITTNNNNGNGNEVTAEDGVLQKDTASSPINGDNGEHTDNNDQSNGGDAAALEAVKNAYAERAAAARAARNHHRASKQQPENDVDNNILDEDEQVEFKLMDLPPFRARLPAAKYREEIIRAVECSRLVIVCGATGCGKSTQIPQYLLEGGGNNNRRRNIVVTQPRRVAAMALAERVASERPVCNGPPGSPNSEVGYHVRLNRAVSPTGDTKITYCTVGIVLRKLLTSFYLLEDVTHLVIDEVHERDISTDFVLTILRERVLPQNPNLKVILMSATNTPQLFIDYFTSRANKKVLQQQQQPIVFTIPGRTFPVQIQHLPQIESAIGYRQQQQPTTHNPPPPTDNLSRQQQQQQPMSPRAINPIDNVFIAHLICHVITTKDDGHAAGDGGGIVILVFLPGKGEIQALFRTLENHKRLQSLLGHKSNNGVCDATIHTLHSQTTHKQQKQIFRPLQPQQDPKKENNKKAVKIVLATNVAETSVTIPDVTCVIDTGRVKENRFNALCRRNELVTVWTSRAAALQRTGRAGRTRPGICYRLYDSKQPMLERTTPEILRSPLEELILSVGCFFENQQQQEQPNNDDDDDRVLGFLRKTLDPPSLESIRSACQQLQTIGALQITPPQLQQQQQPPRIRLTPLGYHLSQLPMDAQLGKLLLVGAILGSVEPALTVAAALSVSASASKPLFWKTQRTNQIQMILQQQQLQQQQLQQQPNNNNNNNSENNIIQGDTLATIAAYNAWTNSQHSNRYFSKKSMPGQGRDRKFQFAKEYGLDHNVLMEISQLREQFRDRLRDAGFLLGNNNNYNNQQQDPNNDNNNNNHPPTNNNSNNTATITTNKNNNDDDRWTSCCLVAGLYPNVATVMRPQRHPQTGQIITKGNYTAGKLLTQNGDVCFPSSNSFHTTDQFKQRASKEDLYVLYHSKQRILGSTNNNASSSPPVDRIFLSELNLCSRWTLLLFCGSGDLKPLKNNAIVLDGWLKFKFTTTTKSTTAAIIVLILELRKELDALLLHRLLQHNSNKNKTHHPEEEDEAVLEVIGRLIDE